MNFVYDPSIYQRYRKEVLFISAEWGKRIELPLSEESFKKALDRNAMKQAPFSSYIYLKDIFNDFTQNFGLVKEGRWLRFLDSDNLKILSKADHVIFSTEEGSRPQDGRPMVQKTFIIQLGK